MVLLELKRLKYLEVGVCFVRISVGDISSLYLHGSREEMGLLFLFIDNNL